MKDGILVALGALTPQELKNLEEDIGISEVKEFAGVNKLRSIRKKCQPIIIVGLVVQPTALDLFCSSLKEGILSDFGWDKKLTKI